jgi:hypothetical protein
MGPAASSSESQDEPKVFKPIHLQNHTFKLKVELDRRGDGFPRLRHFHKSRCGREEKIWIGNS